MNRDLLWASALGWAEARAALDCRTEQPGTVWEGRHPGAAPGVLPQARFSVEDTTPLPWGFPTSRAFLTLLLLSWS